MDAVKEKMNQIDHKLRQVGGKMSMLKRQNMQLLAENVRLKKQLEKNKSNNFVHEKEEEGELETSHVKAANQEDTMNKWSIEIDEYVAKINTCIEDLEKL